MDCTEEKINLISPRPEMEEQYLAYCRAFQRVDEPLQFMDDVAFRDFARFVQDMRDAEQGLNLPPGFVPYTAYWLVREDGVILGNSALRFALTPALEDLGGHIGYRIHPFERRKGYGKLILKLTLGKARERGLERVLVTCDPTNTGSARIIQSNGGVLASQTYSQKYEREVSRYWIEL